MPISIAPEQGGSGNVGGGSGFFVGASRHYEYDYLNGLDLRPGTDLHTKLVEVVIRRAQESSSYMSARYDAWAEVDKMLTTYIDLSESEKTIKDKDKRKPVSLVIPQLYAIRDVILTYFVMAFFDQPPLFQYEGVGDEDVIPAKLLEVLIEQQNHRYKAEVPLYVHFSDMLSYGVGYIAPVWRQDYGKRIISQTMDTTMLGTLASFLGRRRKESFRAVEDTLIFEGNELINIDPYKVLPDPNYASHQIDKGEFFGWIEKTNIHALLRREQNDGDLFNCLYLKDMPNATSQFDTDQTGRFEKSGMAATQRAPGVTRPVTKVNMYIDLIPSDFGLGDSEYPERWFLAIANDSILVECRPLGLLHGKYPVSCGSPDFDGYTVSPISRLETQLGSQEAINWLFNSHIANVRKAIHDMIIYDPYIISTTDLLNPAGGGLIRVNKRVWGRPNAIEQGIKQFAVQDVTRQHIADIAVLFDITGRVSAASDMLQGMMQGRGRERVTGVEARMVAGGSVNRLAKMARLAGAQSMRDIGYLEACHTQQFMSRDTYAKIVGEWPRVLTEEYGTGRRRVTPFDVLCDFDTMVRDGSLPVDTTGAAQTWVDLFRSLVQSPDLVAAGKFDLVRIFKHVARLLGAKNISDFEMKGTVLPSEEVARGVERGNIVKPEELAL